MTTRRRPRKSPARKSRRLGFVGLEERVEREYRRKGYSKARARRIGKAALRLRVAISRARR